MMANQPELNSRHGVSSNYAIVRSVLLPSRIFALVVLLILQTLPITALAQQEARVFVLPVASASGLYQINIEQVLRENYGLKLSTTAEAQSFRWYFYSGALPLGLKITPGGNIVGRPRGARPEPYKFKAKVLDASAGSDELVLMFELKVEPSRVQLVSTNAPKLVPLNEELASDNSGAKISLSDKIAPPWNANHSRPGNSRATTATAAADNTQDSIIGLRERKMTDSARETRVEAAPRSLAVENTSAGLPLPASAAAAQESSCPDCEPHPRRDETKDFIIDARDGTTVGKRRFKLHENARIIIINKNPFLYDYRVTFKNTPIAETAIAGFFGSWPLFVDTFKKSDKKGEGEPVQPSQPSQCQLRQEFPKELEAIDNLHARLVQDAVDLERMFNPLKENYQRVAERVEGYKTIVYDQNSSCRTVCDTATLMRSTLQSYDPDLETVTKAIKGFSAEVVLLQQWVEQLQQLARGNPQVDPATHPACAQELQDLSALAAGYVVDAQKLQTGIQKIIDGNEKFKEVVKIINEVFSHPDAFLKVYFSDNVRKEFDLPNDLEITVERKAVKDDDKKFVKLVDPVTINFGGGARFAIAGGVVVSPFETITFKRVPALVNGQQTTIIGREESSNSRILPILMLHGRLWEGTGTVSGVHFSLGVTAKPTDKETNVEFLLGPSVSFIEQRLFFTFGGYAGRRKQLEGNLVPGQELPKEFTDDIPTSNHLVWKPGFALTYKFK